jgi:hypothetical protein
LAGTNCPAITKIDNNAAAPLLNYWQSGLSFSKKSVHDLRGFGRGFAEAKAAFLI